MGAGVWIAMAGVQFLSQHYAIAATNAYIVFLHFVIIFLLWKHRP